MRVLIDADAFPDIREIIKLCKKYQKEVILYMDTSHEIESDDAKVKRVLTSSNAADLEIENDAESGDLVLTQDYGVATITISKGSICLNQYGKFYTSDHIDLLLEWKNTSRVLRKHHHIKGPKKRTKKDRETLLKNIEEVLRKCSERETR